MVRTRRLALWLAAAAMGLAAATAPGAAAGSAADSQVRAARDRIEHHAAPAARPVVVRTGPDDRQAPPRPNLPLWVAAAAVLTAALVALGSIGPPSARRHRATSERTHPARGPPSALAHR